MLRRSMRHLPKIHEYGDHNYVVSPVEIAAITIVENPQFLVSINDSTNLRRFAGKTKLFYVGGVGFLGDRLGNMLVAASERNSKTGKIETKGIYRSDISRYRTLVRLVR